MSNDAQQPQNPPADGAHTATGGTDGTPTGPASTSRVDFVAREDSPQFRQLKRTHRSFVLPLAAAFFLWYIGYVLLGAYAHDFMSRPVVGSINVGVVLGLAQFVTTFVITMAYVSFANRKLDPQAEAIRAELEAEEAALAEQTGGNA
ncbi:DUF485 domain-containing protein [Brevibacterium litoralis]|uniref:DUF485 domain-containing protein n=1 Tax=Brevibacterium litoralis TaxID=3138935 RepID=UPI0032EB813F